MKTIYAVLLLVIFFHSKTDAQYYLTNAGGATIDEGLSISTTHSGESYITGYYTGAANLGNGSFTSLGLTDGFVVKIDASGNYVWANSFGGTGVDKGTSIATDNAGNAYVAIAFESTITIGANSFTSFGLRDILIAKYSAAGNLLWAQQAGGSGNDNVTSINVDNTGNIAITGSFTGTATFGSNVLSSTINPVTSNPSADIFIAKLNTNGVFLWSKKGTAIDDDNGYDVAFDQTGAVYLYAQFSDTLTFDVTHFNDINNAVCLLKFDSSGNEIWYKRFVGTSTQPTSIAVDASNHITAVGNFTGTLNVFTTPFTTLTATYSNRYYLLRFDELGNLNWLVAKSSDSPVSANDVVIGSNNSVNVIGDFRCRMNDFADVYGQGTFNSVGYGDVFASVYDSSGTWQLARQCGGPKDDAVYGAGIDSNDYIYFTGSFVKQFNAPLSTGSFSCVNTNTASPYCNDNQYNFYCYVMSSDTAVVGNRDMLAAKSFDLSRQPYDYFSRNGSGCVRDILPICINEQLTQVYCVDTVMLCGFASAVLGVTTNYSDNLGCFAPHLNYQWSNGFIAPVIPAFAGTYTVTVTNEDGCLARTASIYLGSISPPLTPLISDSKGINVNANPTAAITLCEGDSVTLWATNISSGYIFGWDTNGVTVLNDSITISQAGTYYFHVGDPANCPAINFITINVSPAIDSLGIFKIVVNNDYDYNDTVAGCENNIVASFIDSVTLGCFPVPPAVQWSITPYANQSAGGFPCLYGTTAFAPDSTGLYTLTAIWIVNDSCNHDTIGPVSKSIYFIKLAEPDPPMLSITGISQLCPSGDTTTLTCDSALNYFWSGAGIITNDTLQSIQVNQPGTFFVSSTVTSVDGCTATGSAFFTVNYKPNPAVSITPNSGVICPNDSVMLVCYTPGSYQWIGPSGSLGVDSFIVYASQPGNYYCVVTDTDGCVLISNNVVALSYSSPTLLVTPTNIACNGSGATIQVIAGANDVWQWQPPLSGNAAFQTVYAAGTYTCAFLSCNNTIIDSVVITSPVFPSSISVNGNTPICWGDSILLTAPAGYSYLWFPTGDTVQAFYASLPGFYYVRMTDSMGCYDFTDSVFIWLVGQPAIPVLSSNSPVCEGASIQLYGTGSAGMSYSWNGPAGFSSTQLNPVISNATLADSGLYYMNVLNGACSSDTATINISVLPKPGAPAVTSNSPLCTGDTLTLTSNGATLQSYQWSGPAGFSSTLQNPFIANVSLSNGGTYIVLGYNGNCYSDTSFINVQINTIPPIPVITSNNPVCEGGNLQFTSTSAASSFTWIGPGGFTSSQQNPLITNVQLVNAGVYYLITSNGICFADTVAYTVTVNPTPAMPTITGNNIYCTGDSIMLSTTNTAVNYYWYGPNGFTSSQQQIIIYNATIANSGSYQLAISDGVCLSDTASMLITVNPALSPPVLNAVGALCEGDDLLLSTISSGFTNYFWTGPAGFTSTDQNPVVSNVSVSNAGNYSLIVSDGCESEPSSINVSINKNPNLTNISSNSPVCEGDELQLTFAATDFDSVYWNFGATVLYGNPNLIIQNTQLINSGYYVVNLLNSNCKNSDSLFVEVNECEIIIPNVFTPNDDGFNDAFEFESTFIENINYKFFDRWGLVVYEGSGNSLNWNGKLKGTGNDVPEGTYYYIFDLTFTDKTQKQVKGYFELLR